MGLSSISFPIKTPKPALLNVADKPRPHMELAAILTAIILFVGVVLLFCVKSKHGLFDSGIHPYMLKWAGSSSNDAAGQRAAQRFVMVASALLFLAGPWLLRSVSPLVNRACSFAPQLVVPLLFVFFASALAFCSGDSLAVSLALASAGFITFAVQRNSPWQFSSKDYLSLTVILFLLATVPSLLIPLDLTRISAQQLVEIQSHFSTVVMTGDRLAVGQHIFSDVRQYYGLLFQPAAGIWQRFIGVISFGDYVQVVRCLTTIFLGSMAWQYLKFARSPGLAGFVPFLLLLPWMHTNQLSILYPNLSAWRLIGIPLCFGTLLYLRKRNGAKRCLLLGVLSCVLLMLNLETGLALTAGVLAFVAVDEQLLKFRSGKLCARHLAILGTGLVLTGTLFLLLARLGLGYWPDCAAHVLTLSQLFRTVKTGYSTMPFVYDPMAWLILAHSVYVILKLSFKRGQQYWCSNDSFRVAVTVTSIVWFSYYFNRPDPWCLYSQYPIYGFLVCDLVRTIKVQRKRYCKTMEPLLPLALALSFVVVPQMIVGARFAQESYCFAWSSLFHGAAERGGVEVSGVFVPQDVASSLVRMAEFIKRQSKDGPVTYVTSNAVFVHKLSGVYSTVHIEDPFQELIFDHQTAAFVDALVKEGPAIIYFDAPNSLMSGDVLHNECFNQLRARLSPYYKKGAILDGWESWHKI